MEDKKSKTEEKTVAKTIKTIVVGQLPTQPVRTGTTEDGTEVNLVSAEEAFTEILETVRELKKGLI